MKNKKFYGTKAFRWILAGLLAFVLISSDAIDKMIHIYANEEGQVEEVDNSAAEEAAREAEEAARREAEEAARRAEEEAARKAQEEAERKAAEEAARKAEEEAARKAAEEEEAKKAAEEEAAKKAAEEEAAKKAAEEEAAKKAAEEEAAKKAAEEEAAKQQAEEVKPTDVPEQQAPEAEPVPEVTEAPTPEATEAPTAEPIPEATMEPTTEPTPELTATPEPTEEPIEEPAAPGTATFYVLIDGEYEEVGGAQIVREGETCYVSKDDVKSMCEDLGLKESDMRGAWSWGVGSDANPGKAGSRLNWTNGRYEFAGYDEKAAGADVFVLADKAFSVNNQEETPETVEPEATAEPETPAEPEATAEPETTVVPEVTMEPEATTEPEVTMEPETVLYTATISVGGKSVNVREAADAESALVGRIFDGASVAVFSEEDGWCLVEGESVNRSPVKGFVSAKFVRQGAEPVATPEPVATEEPEPTLEPTTMPAPTESPKALYEFKRDEQGGLVLDELGNPVAIVPEGAEVPVNFKRDEQGALVLDEAGNPIVLDTVPAGADKITSILDELNPERYIDVYAAWDGDKLQFGDQATLIAVLHGYENTAFTLQWQTSKDEVNWVDVEDAEGERHSLEITEDNYTDYWRVQVLISDVL